jgi:hypothetical protein
MESHLEENMKTISILVLAAFVLVALTGCAARPNELANQPVAGGTIAGFWQGVWQGLISPFAFIISLFNPAVGVYDVHNNGGWYNLGFLLGAAIILGGSGRGSSYRRH